MDGAREFPRLGEQTYLNSCAHGLLPRRTRAAIDAHMTRWESDPDWGAWGEAVEDARRAFAQIIHGRPEEIAVVANASQGVGAVMSSLHPAPARRALVTWEGDFPTSPYLAERQRGRGFEHRQRVDPWAQHLGEDAALAVLPFVASFSGYRLDIKRFAAQAHARGTPLLVDAFQAAGTFDIDVKKLDVDFLVSGVYKWLLAPAGLAFLYVRPDHFALEPASTGWMGAEAPYAFDPLGAPARDARRFQSGGPSVISCVGAASSIGLVNEIGPRAIEAHNRVLAERVMAGAEARKWEILTPRAPEERASIVTFRGMDVEKSLAALAREKVVVNPRLGGLRVSPHFYNAKADVDRLFAVLDRG
jgi:selenocysteine lyase/cysteine desulfurase